MKLFLLMEPVHIVINKKEERILNMIIIKYKGLEVTCTSVDEAIEFVKKLEVDEKSNFPKEQPIVLPKITWENFKWSDCENCPNRPDPNNSTFGDSPCTFCKNHLPTCKE